MAATEEITVPADPLEWRPQVALDTNRHSPITDPIVEPLWSGWRVLVHFDSTHPGSVKLIDGFGDDIAGTEPEVVAELTTAVLAGDAVIDAILTEQATRSSEGVAVLHAWAHAKRWRPGLLAPLYLLLLMPPLNVLVVLPLSMVGLVDQWFDLRASLRAQT